MRSTTIRKEPIRKARNYNLPTNGLEEQEDSRPKPAWISRNGRLTILKGDCLTSLRSLGAGSVDVVVTSPPYNIGLAYNSYKDTKPHEEYLSWLLQVARDLKRVLADDGSFFLNVGGTNADPWKPMEIALRLREEFCLQNHIIWAKSVSIGDESYGHFKPINSERFLNNTFEHIFHFTKKNNSKLDRLAVGVPFKDKSNIARFGHARDRRCAGNIWYIPYRTVQSKAEKHNHPGTYPVDLAKRCILLHGKKEATVLDPFLGTGTTLVAAHETGCRGIGLELDAAYCKVAADRLSRVSS